MNSSRRLEFIGALTLLLNSCPQPRNRLVPLIRDSCEVIPGLRHRAGSDREPTLPANTLAADKAGMLQHLQVLGNCLACQIETVGQCGNRVFPTVTEARYQLKACDTAQGRKHGCPGLASSLSRRHMQPRSWPVCPSPLCSTEALPGVSILETAESPSR